MPVITIDIGPISSREVKARLIESVTQAASSSTSIPADKFTVLINEMDRDNIGVGGVMLSDLLK